jgi:hypothetical protein
MVVMVVITPSFISITCVTAQLCATATYYVGCLLRCVDRFLSFNYASFTIL